MKNILRIYFKFIFYLFVLIGYISSNAGSFEDFFVAIKQDNSDTITTLIKRGFDVNTRNPAGESALYLAVSEPSPKVMAILLAWNKPM